jgi:hypothetical protein
MAPTTVSKKVAFVDFCVPWLLLAGGSQSEVHTSHTFSPISEPAARASSLPDLMWNPAWILLSPAATAASE